MKYCNGVLLTNSFTLSVPFFSGDAFRRWIANSSDPGVMVSAFYGVSVGDPRAHLSEGARRMLDLPNAGGNSVWSEVMSYEVIRIMFNCRLCYTETELAYFPYGSSISDYSVSTHARAIIGVSVTRAMAYRFRFTLAEAIRLLTKKLYGVINSTRCVMKNMRWLKQILHVWVQEPYMIPILLEAYHQHVDPGLHANTLLVLTVSHNAS